MPDNYSQFEEHERAAEHWFASRPVCACCGEPIQDDYKWLIDRLAYCDDCAKDLFRMPTLAE